MGSKFYDGFENEVNLIDCLKCIVKHKKYISIFFVISLAIALIHNLLIGKNFEATAVVRIGSTTEQLMVTKLDARHMLESRKFLRSVLKKYDLEINPLEPKFSVYTADLIKYPDLILIKVRYPLSPLAVKMCNSLAEEFVAEENELYVMNLNLLKKQINDLKKEKVLFTTAIAMPAIMKKDRDQIYTYLVEKELLLEKQLLNLKDFEVVENAVLARDCLRSKRQKNLVVIPLIGVMGSIFIFVFKKSSKKNTDV